MGVIGAAFRKAMEQETWLPLACDWGADGQ